MINSTDLDHRRQ